MHLPFFDQISCAQHIADLLGGADPPFQSVSLIGEKAGRLAKNLAAHLPAMQMVVAEQPADVALSFDSIHVLPVNQRAAHVEKIAALAKREAIIACPLGTDLQITIYRSLEKLAHEQNQSPPTELTEAVAHGLPTPQDAASWAHGYNDLDLFYAGDVAYFQDQATRFLFKQAQSPLRRALLRLTSAHAPSVTELPLPPETVPMRRHRRLFLILRKR